MLCERVTGVSSGAAPGVAAGHLLACAADAHRTGAQDAHLAKMDAGAFDWDVSVDQVLEFLFEEDGNVGPVPLDCPITEQDANGSLFPDLFALQPVQMPVQGSAGAPGGPSPWTLPSLQPAKGFTHAVVTTGAAFCPEVALSTAGSDHASADSLVLPSQSSGLPTTRSSSGYSPDGAAELPLQPVLEACTTTISPQGAQSSVQGVSSWQELLHGAEQPPPPLPSRPGRGRGRGRGAGQTHQAISKPPAKDKKRENSLLIKQLEQEVQAKLQLVKQLEGQNTDLKRKERLLQLSVDTSEHTFNRLVDHQLGPNLKTLLMSFRGSYNRATADRVLAKMAHLESPKDMTIEVFCQTWQTLVMEMCDVLMVETMASTDAAKRDAQEHLTRLFQSVTDFCLAMCAHHCDLIVQAKAINLATGEEVTADIEHWAGVASKLGLSEEQVQDLAGAFDMFLRCCESMSQERRQLMAQLDANMAGQSQPLVIDTALTLAQHMGPVIEINDKLRANMMRCQTLHTMVCFLALRLMTPQQVAQMCMHASPLFPNIHLLLAAIRLQAQPPADKTPLSASLEYRTLLNALS